MGLETVGSCNKSQVLYVVIVTHLAFVFVNWRHKVWTFSLIYSKFIWWYKEMCICLCCKKACSRSQCFKMVESQQDVMVIATSTKV